MEITEHSQQCHPSGVAKSCHRHEGDRTGLTAAGFSILEVLVALAIGAILLLALTDVLVSSKVSYVAEENRSRIQETGRFAILTIARDARATRSFDCFMAGMLEQYVLLSVKACQLLDPTPTTCDSKASAFIEKTHILNPANPLGYDASAAATAGTTTTSAWLGSMPDGAAGNIRNRWLRGDILITWGLVGEGTLVTDPLPLPTSEPYDPGPIKVTNIDGLARGNLAAITDCVNTDVFVISNVYSSTKAVGHGTSQTAREDAPATTAVNARAALSAAYNWVPGNPAQTGQKEFPARVFPLDYKVFYICCVNTRSGSLQDGTNVAKCKTDPTGFRPGLCQWDASRSQRSQVLVLDVADMRVTYSGRQTGSLARFQADDRNPIPTAAWVSTNNRWPDVTGISLELLVASPDDNVRATSSEQSPANPLWPPNDGSSVNADTLGSGLPADRRLYERFVMTLALRSGTPWQIRQ